MELHQLRYVVAVADHGSFTAAAAALHVSQSGVSAQVAKLERELGHRLFDRGARTVRTTPEGAALLPHARSAGAAVETIRAIADDLSGVVRGHIRLGTVIGCTIPGYLTGFAAFRHAHPGVTVAVTEGNSDDLLSALVGGGLDVALVAHARPLPPDLLGHTVIREPLTVTVPNHHPWAARTSLTCAELAGETVLCLPPGTGVRTAFEITCAAERIEIAPAVQAHSPEALLALADRGAGAAVLTASMAAGRPDSATIPLARSARTQLSLATRIAPSAAAGAMSRTLLDHLTS
ncbi:Transcriptional regulator, LysR family OS=Tsukamurella paurometabola (strain ATCC 8368 / DSM/ CCUG 35730 / CIP 100753 / JCM 10117 / KCTC 9821 / NBRC 16120/ NCIMB 702349 / NCTC 13040) OX=521096 GN=Tpau_1281 PE=3 SV=1 [Tsukamurella paurometabola]|uniref:Transcriptional regulator, LysR family n=1 Tax=Tsukamurella paurometabola (strain ATCC 8368 / DSM 20162 / CCUG 35730 / CIP 100753 / JCM 10117 / KCTC 9821 / NBRC 16120 / NCIMB 702349 / NCTC 13040) TaxID=521096 RepID=D5UWN9_TSUPD|nr:LysR substrate-binding domain-containing protein [Tsukamurella paurometabola]ADG77911.1 transcriptional regulator, LysR family [Tsukamurella paurometabola DSM 20162]SUP29323.1 HTH-type transcriptional regulator gltC [Tsukamurella paurometabola]